MKLSKSKTWFLNIALMSIAISLFITLLVRDKSDAVEVILGSNLGLLIIGFFAELGINLKYKERK